MYEKVSRKLGVRGSPFFLRVGVGACVRVFVTYTTYALVIARQATSREEKTQIHF